VFLTSQGAAGAAPGASNRGSMPKAAPIHSAQSSDLVFFSGKTNDLHRRKKPEDNRRPQLNKMAKVSFMTSSNPNVSAQRRVLRDVAPLPGNPAAVSQTSSGLRPVALRPTLSDSLPFSGYELPRGISDQRLISTVFCCNPYARMGPRVTKN
jgi:hypothetical protein